MIEHEDRARSLTDVQRVAQLLLTVFGLGVATGDAAKDTLEVENFSNFNLALKNLYMYNLTKKLNYLTIISFYPHYIIFYFVYLL